ncbi:MAG: hypothetical protein QW814_00550 [Methanothrix sp.]
MVTTRRIYRPRNMQLKRNAMHSTSTVVRLTNMSNLNSVKSILMAMQVSLKYADSVFATNSGNSTRLKRIRQYISRLNRVSDLLHTDMHMEPDVLYRELRLAAIAYVNLFYGASKEDREAFMSSCMSDSYGRAIEPLNNLILLPSMLAENGVPIGKASFSILTGLHRKSFLAIKHAMKSAVSVELFRNSSAIGNNTENLERLNKSIDEIDGIMSNMHGLMKDYETVEAKKLELIEEMCDIGDKSGFPVDSIIESVSAPYMPKHSNIMRK